MVRTTASAVAAVAVVLAGAGCDDLVGLSESEPSLVPLAGAAIGAGPTIALAAYASDGKPGIQVAWAINDRPYRQLLWDHELVMSSLVGGVCLAVSAPPDPLPEGAEDYVFVSRDGESFDLWQKVEAGMRRLVHLDSEPGVLYYYRVQRADADGNVLATSPVAMAVRAPNLITSGGFEKEMPGPVVEDIDLPDWRRPTHGRLDISVYRRRGQHGRQFLSILPAEGVPDETLTRVRLESKPIEIKPNSSYVQSGGVRCPEGTSRVWIGRRWLDAAGETIGETYALVAAVPQRWTFFSQRLRPAGEGIVVTRGEDATFIPPNVASVVYVVRAEAGGRGVQLEALALKEVVRPQAAALDAGGP